MRLLIVEDEAELATALARGLRQQGYAVDVAPDGRQGWELATANEYDLLVLDLTLPEMDGLELCQRLRSSRPRLLILILTARGQPADRVRGLDLGADDYVAKPFYFDELSARIRALLRRDLRVREPILACADLKMDVAGRVAWQGGHPLRLTRKEFGVLEYFMRRPGEVVSQEELLEHVWDASADAFSNSMRVHIASLRRKLGDDAAAPRYIKTVIGQGYQLICARPA
ncbi:MAG: response regulator transcription factor [Candidatus Promineifilaceae bacterium]